MKIEKIIKESLEEMLEKLRIDYSKLEIEEKKKTHSQLISNPVIQPH